MEAKPFFNTEDDFLLECRHASSRPSLKIGDVQLVSTKLLHETPMQVVFHLPDHKLWIALARLQ